MKDIVDLLRMNAKCDIVRRQGLLAFPLRTLLEDAASEIESLRAVIQAASPQHPRSERDETDSGASNRNETGAS